MVTVAFAGVAELELEVERRIEFVAAARGERPDTGMSSCDPPALCLSAIDTESRTVLNTGCERGTV
ncbi:hypothetical protein CV102_17930 [Natronococcus pandeyae]|uniref:Uncharacterized protein n=1 Tax=Natronococcus pandeyae TaxID=2055836 RepID=A0A8J8Q3T9_9EURY|nr:hypothetical protein [Natronococcus pandeyae]TYL37199.1 hypothetical protein CV102_17930 [Natronococcus pandeyae]